MYFIGDEEIEALKVVFEKKRLFRYQPNMKSECDLFEEEFSRRFSMAHSLILSSGTNALLLALLSSGFKVGDEVLLPTYTFIATASAIIQAGGIPILVDIDENLSLDLKDAQKKLSTRSRALILVHMDGLVANIKDAVQFCRNNNLLLIEDAAQSLGSSLNDKMIGTYGDFGCFSLNESKTLSCGEGGILITNNSEFFNKAYCLHDGPIRFSPTRKQTFAQTTPFFGYSMRVSEIHGAIMRVQLKRLDYILEQLQQRRNIFINGLSDLKEAKLVIGYSADTCSSSIHLQFSSVELGAKIGAQLRQQGLLFAPATTRPAHASWKWSFLMGDSAHIQNESNPFLRTNEHYDYSSANYLTSLDILSRTYKFDFSIETSLSELDQQVQIIQRTLQNV